MNPELGLCEEGRRRGERGGGGGEGRREERGGGGGRGEEEGRGEEGGGVREKREWKCKGRWIKILPDFWSSLFEVEVEYFERSVLRPH